MYKPHPLFSIKKAGKNMRLIFGFLRYIHDFKIYKHEGSVKRKAEQPTLAAFGFTKK